MGHATVRLAGRTVIAAVHDPGLARAVADASASCGALVAVACPDPQTVVALNEQDRPGLVSFCIRADDTAAWHRLVAHVEQRLGPIDGLVVAPHPSWDRRGLDDSVRMVAADMRERGVGTIVCVGPDLRTRDGELPGDASSGGPVRRVTVLDLPDPFAAAAMVLTALAGE